MTAFMDIGSTTPILATMIGLAVGIDYALFILARYRGELEHTDDREEAVGIAVGTAGSAVVFAGLTVLIALSALAVVRIPFLTTMGIAAAAPSLIAVLVALTLLPAILGLTASPRPSARGCARYAPKRDADGRILNNGVRWARLVGRAPVAVVVLVVVGARRARDPAEAPAPGLPDRQHRRRRTPRSARPPTSIADAFGPGRERPLLVVVDGRDVPAADRAAAYGEVAAWAAGQDGVVNAQVVAQNEQGTGAQVLVTPATGAGRHRAPRTCSPPCATARPASRSRPAPPPASPG